MNPNVPFAFKVLARDGKARAGIFATPHGPVETPSFMPVGTQASVKALSPGDLRAAGARMVLANAYHLALRPGEEIVAAAGGLHRFMSWDGPLLTDSGGFQVFSLAPFREISEEGVRFRSHLDGSSRAFTPESATALQHVLGADVIMAFDECVPYPAERDYVEISTDRTTRWAARCRDAHRKAGREGRQALFGILQGGFFRDLRERSAAGLRALDFPGYAVGGVSVGEPKEEMRAMAEFSAELLPEDKPRYLMGVGTPEDLLAAAAVGYDLFDCVYPTRVARNGTALTRSGRLNLRNARFTRDASPLDPACSCEACRNHTRSYLAHLLRAGELLVLRFLSLHNVRFLGDLCGEIRRAIQEGCLESFRREAEGRLRGAGSESRGGVDS